MVQSIRGRLNLVTFPRGEGAFTLAIVQNGRHQTSDNLFVEHFGEAGRLFASNLGITRIEPNGVTLGPRLLGERFKRHAEQVVLEKNGINE